MAVQKFVPLVVMCGIIFLTGWGAARFGDFGASGVENNAIGDRQETRGLAFSSADAAGDAPFVTSAMSSGAVAATSHYAQAYRRACHVRG
jgi:hypothetical protein